MAYITGDTIKNLREKKKLTQKQLSEKQIRQSQRLWPVQKCLLAVIARRLGCKTRLDARPLLGDTGKNQNK